MTASSQKVLRAGIVGFRGYSGAELVRILSTHPFAQPILIEHRDSEPEVSPRNAPKLERLPLSAPTLAGEGIDVVFLATPPEVSIELARSLLDANICVIDLSGAFRLRSVATYKEWYKAEHAEPELLASAVYGLPEFYRDKLPGAKLVSNPGCYPTAANLAIAPLVRAGAIDLSAGIVCDAKSGVSGAGRKPSLKTHFCEVTENFSAYSLLDHRHVPEVLQNSGIEEAHFSFTAQLIPIHRGILETIYFRGGEGQTALKIIEHYEQFYTGSSFVRLYDPGAVPDVKAVQRTNFCDIGFKYDEKTRRGVLVTVIDNLGKGAAGQAVQNMNLVFGLNEAEGLV